MTRTCPRCGANGPPTAFPLLPPESTPARHAERRYECPACRFRARAFAFSPAPPCPVRERQLVLT
jgi:transposase